MNSHNQNFLENTTPKTKIVKETLKNIKVYVPIVGYNSEISFEENFAQSKVKLLQVIPASDFKDDPINEYLSFPLIQKYLTEDSRGKQQDCSRTSLTNFNKITEDLSSDTKCNNFAINTGDLSSNSANKEVVKQHICDVCLKHFKHRRDLALHYLMHSEKEKKRAAKVTKKCDICNKPLQQCHCKSIMQKIYPSYDSSQKSFNFSQPINSSIVFVLAESISGDNTIIKRVLFHCPECELPFGLESQLKQHILVHKRDKSKRDKKSNICNTCNQEFGDENILARHLSTHHSDNLNVVSNQNVQESQNCLSVDLQVCTSCHTIFNDTDGLRRHLKRLGWVCIICNMYFCLKSDFHSHYLAHMNINPLMTVNNNSKSNSLSLTTQKHTCTICNQSFKFLSLLKRHLLCHSLNKYYFCLWCKKRFKQKLSAYIHYFCHKKKKNTCSFCHKIFFLKKCLHFHFKTHLIE